MFTPKWCDGTSFRCDQNLVWCDVFTCFSLMLVWADKTFGSQAIDIYLGAVLYTGLQVTSGLLGLKQPPLAAINAATLRSPIQMTAPLAAKFSS